MSNINNKNDFNVLLENSKKTGVLAGIEKLYEQVFREAYALGYHAGRLSMSQHSFAQVSSNQERRYIQSLDSMTGYNRHITSLIQDLYNRYERGEPVDDQMLNRAESLKNAAYEQAKHITNRMTKNIHDKTTVVDNLIKYSLRNKKQVFDEDSYFNRFVGEILNSAKSINKNIQNLLLDQENQKENIQKAQKLAIVVLAHTNRVHQKIDAEKNTINTYMKFTNGQ